MEMDLGTAIIGAISIILCALPFVMIRRSRKKREKVFLQSLSEIASKNNSQITQNEIFGSFAIGIDEIKNFVFSYRSVDDNVSEQIIDLGEIQSCKVINTSKTFTNNDASQKVIGRLELSFIPTAKNKPEIRLEFFNTDVNPQLNGELQSIEKWAKHINELLNHKK